MRKLLASAAITSVFVLSLMNDAHEEQNHPPIAQLTWVEQHLDEQGNWVNHPPIVEITIATVIVHERPHASQL